MSDSKHAPLSRRRVFAGAGAASALAGVAALVSRSEPAEVVAEAAKPAPEAGGGYQLTDHVKRYYQTAKV
ncbi:formate dehydrogenase [Aquabacterium sp. OR-4]|uniref:formate dehydrogenase n=1 Tax=Aquabacterium sp. OR-4 TaxID=2978127 RepID=UPI0021B3706A|nr:formate dehydrogenase [Aquabacterium sp. OR-4]MDT7838682.1 formate dehydrogenase [Aquabacterium sp. OR-4]